MTPPRFGHRHRLVDPGAVRPRPLHAEGILPHDRCSLGHKKKKIRLVVVNQLLQFAALADDLVAVKFLAHRFEQAVGFLALVADHVEALGLGLGRVPDLELVEALPQGPAKHHGIEFPLVDEALEKDRPLVHLDRDLDPDRPEVFLHECRDVAADDIPIVRDEGESEALSVFHADPVLARNPAGFVKQLPRFLRIVSERLDPRVEKPHFRREDPRALRAISVEDVANHLVDIDRVGQGLADAQILKHGAPQIPPDVVEGIARRGEERESLVLAKTPHRPGICRPKINLLCLKSEAEGQRVGQGSENNAIQMRETFEVVLVPRHAHKLVRLPLGELERTRSDRRTVEDQWPLVRGHVGQQVSGQDTHHPALQGRRKRTTVNNPHRARIGGFHGEHQFVIRLARRSHAVVHDGLVGELHVPRAERRAVVPADILMQAELNHRLGQKFRC